MKINTLFFLACGGILVGLISIYAYSQKIKPEPPLNVSYNPYKKGIYATGIVESYQPSGSNINIYAEVPGKVTAVFVQDGTVLKKDAAIWIDITALGGMFHAARVYITPDSFFMINYQQKTVTKVPLKDVAKILPTQVDFQSLQRLITGEPLRDGSLRNVVSLDASWLLHVADENYRQELEYRKKDSVLLNDKLNTVAANGPQAMMRYDNFEMVDNHKIATSRSVTIQNGADKFLLEMEIENPVFEKELEMPFNVPKNYSLK